MVSPARQITNGGRFGSRAEQIVNPVWNRDARIPAGSAQRSFYKLLETNLNSRGSLQLVIGSRPNFAHRLY